MPVATTDRSTVVSTRTASAMLTHRGIIGWVTFLLLTLTALTPACDAWWHRGTERKDAVPVTSQGSGIDGPRKDGVPEDDVSKDSAGSGLLPAATGGGEDAGSAKQCQGKIIMRFSATNHPCIDL